MASRPVSRPAGPERVPGDGGSDVGLVVWFAVRAGPVARVRRPVAGGRQQVSGVRHGAKFPGGDIERQFAGPDQRGRRRIRLDGYAGGHGGRAARSVRGHERLVTGRRTGVPDGRLPFARDAVLSPSQRATGRGAARVRLVPSDGQPQRGLAGPDEPERARGHDGAGHVPRAVRGRRQPRGPVAGGRRVFRAAGGRHQLRGRVLDEHAVRPRTGAPGERGRRVRGRPAGVHRGRRAAHRPVGPPAAVGRLAPLSGRRHGRVRMPPVRVTGRQRQPVHRLGRVHVRRPVHRGLFNGRRHRARRAARRNVPGQRQVARRVRGGRRVRAGLVRHQQNVPARLGRCGRVRHVRAVLRGERRVGRVRVPVPVRDQRHVAVRHTGRARRL